MRLLIQLFIVLGPFLLLSACAPKGPTIHIHKSATCGCCTDWIEQLAADGFIVEVEEGYSAASRARELGIPKAFQSCFTANVGSIFIQGEVPPEDIRRALKKVGDAAGLATREQVKLESLGGDTAPGDVLLFKMHGSVEVFAHHHP